MHPPRWDFIPTGELRLHLLRPEYTLTFQTWKDTAKHPLEDQLHAILVGFLDDAMRIKAQRDEQNRRDLENRRKEQLKWNQSRRREANAKVIHELESQAGAWQRARLLRSYLRALKRTVGTQRIEAMNDKTSVDFLAWAEHYVDQLDPLCATPHDPDLMQDSLQRYGAEEAVRQTLSRLMGNHWQDSWKVSAEGDDLTNALTARDENL